MSAPTSRNRTPPKSIDAKRTRGLDANDELHQYQFSEFLVDHLIDCLRLFRGDLEEMLVLEVIRQKSLLTRFDAAAEARPRSGAVEPAVTASHIAKKTGIPRQTVRRKLLSLERRGWVTHADGPTWRFTAGRSNSAIDPDLANLDRRGASRLAKLIEASISS